jgi:hypothetical protein
MKKVLDEIEKVAKSLKEKADDKKRVIERTTENLKKYAKDLVKKSIEK